MPRAPSSMAIIAVHADGLHAVIGFMPIFMAMWLIFRPSGVEIITNLGNVHAISSPTSNNRSIIADLRQSSRPHWQCSEIFMPVIGNLPESSAIFMPNVGSLRVLHARYRESSANLHAQSRAVSSDLRAHYRHSSASFTPIVGSGGSLRHLQARYWECSAIFAPIGASLRHLDARYWESLAIFAPIGGSLRHLHARYDLRQLRAHWRPPSASSRARWR